MSDCDIHRQAPMTRFHLIKCPGDKGLLWGYFCIFHLLYIIILRTCFPQPTWLPFKLCSSVMKIWHFFWTTTVCWNQGKHDTFYVLKILSPTTPHSKNSESIAIVTVTWHVGVMHKVSHSPPDILSDAISHNLEKFLWIIRGWAK